MRIKANQRICEGFANCVSAAPDLFDIDDDDRVVVLRPELDRTDRSRVEEAVRSCPVTALSIADA